MSMYTSELFEFQIICVELWEWCSANCLASMQIGSCEGAQGAAAGLSSDNLGSHLLWSSWDPPFISVYNCFFAKLAFNLTVVLAGSFAPPIIPQIMRDPSFPNVLFRGRDSFLHEFFQVLIQSRWMGFGRMCVCVCWKQEFVPSLSIGVLILETNNRVYNTNYTDNEPKAVSHLQCALHCWQKAALPICVMLFTIQAKQKSSCLDWNCISSATVVGMFFWNNLSSNGVICQNQNVLENVLINFWWNI